MITFDPDKIDVKVTKHDEPVKGLAYSEWEMTVPEQGGTAYIRISPQLRDFFKLCHEKHGVIGFEYDFDEAGLNFGLILKKDKES